MIADVALSFLYALALLFCRDKRGAILALVLFHLSFYISSVSFIDQPYQHHLFTAAIYCAGVLSRSRPVKVAFFLIVAFQYLMAVDAYLNPTTITIMYEIYPTVALALNLFLLSSIGKWAGEYTYGTHNSGRSFYRRWRNGLSRVAVHRKDKGGLRKGEAK